MVSVWGLFFLFLVRAVAPSSKRELHVSIRCEAVGKGNRRWMTTRLGAVVLGDLGQNHQLPQAWHDCCSESKGKWLRISHSTAFPEALLQNWVKNHNQVGFCRETDLAWAWGRGLRVHPARPRRPTAGLVWATALPWDIPAPGLPEERLCPGCQSSGDRAAVFVVTWWYVDEGLLPCRLSGPAWLLHWLAVFCLITLMRVTLCQVVSALLWCWHGPGTSAVLGTASRSLCPHTGLWPTAQKLETWLPQLRWGLAACGAVSPARPAAR